MNSGRGFFTTILNYAYRNLARNRRRSLLTMATVTLSVIVTVIAICFADAGMQLWKVGIIEYGTGHAQFRTQAAWKSFQSLREDHFVRLPGGLEEQLANEKMLEAASERLNFSGLLTTGSKSIYFLAQSFDPITEKKLSPKIFEESGLEGEFISADSEDGVVVGRLLAETLEVKVGDSATMMAQTMKGQIDTYDVVIRGIIDLPVVNLSKRLVYMHINQARKILDVDDAYTELALRVKDDVLLSPFITRYKEKADKAGLITLAWWDIWPFVPRIEQLLYSIVGVICLLLFLSAGISVLNVIFLTVEERTIEIGTLMALGVRGPVIWLLLSAEAGLIGIFGGAAGSVIASVALFTMGQIGFPFKNPLGPGLINIYPAPDVKVIVVVSICGVILSLIAAILPALKATRIEPVNAFRRITR